MLSLSSPSSGPLAWIFTCIFTAWLAATLMMNIIFMASQPSRSQLQAFSVPVRIGVITSNTFSENIIDHRCEPSMPFCERSGKCLVVEVSDRRKLFSKYPRLLNAEVDLQRLHNLDKNLLRSKHLRVRTIEMFLSGCGFFTFPLIVMNQLHVAKREGLIGDKKPIVYMPESHHYFDFHCNNDQDFWERWFEPIADVRWQDVDESDVWEFSQDSIKTIYYDYRNIHAYPYGGSKDAGNPEWINENRARAYLIFQEFIRVRPELVEESKNMFSKLVGGKPVIGLHMRGTDKFVTRKVDVADYDRQVDRFLRYHGNGVVLVATDDNGYLDHMKQEYGEKIVALSVMREEGNVLYNDELDKNRKSKEVLMDMIAMSWVDVLVKGWSGVSEFSIYHRRTRDQVHDFGRIVDLQLFVTGKNPRSKSDESIVSSFYEGPFNDDELTRTQYLPDNLYADDFAMKETIFRNLEAELKAVTSAQCHGPVIQPKICEWGFASALHSIVKVAMHAITYGYCLKDPVGWTKYKCDANISNSSSPFEPLAASEYPTSTMAELADFEALNTTARKTRNDPTSCVEVFHTPFTLNRKGVPTFFQSREYKDCMKRYSMRQRGNAMLPPSHQPIGLFASVSLILHHLFRPAPSLTARLEQEKIAMNWPSDGIPVLGVHYRAGDSCFVERGGDLGRRCEDFSVTMKEADKMRQKYGIRHIFLATDSDSVFDQLEQYSSNWTFHYVNDTDRGGLRNVESVDALLKKGSIDGCREAFECSLDIFLLAQCDAFVGKFSSNLDRLAYNLMFARARRHLPHVSIDNEWCFDYGLRSRIPAPRYAGETGSRFQAFFC